MKKYKIISAICFVIWIISTILQIYNPHPYRGLIGNLILVIGIVSSLIYAKKNKIKSPLYDPNKRKHIRNWVMFIIIIVIIVIIVVLIFLNFL